MKYRQLGNAGVRASELCFGTWRFGRKTNGVRETNEERAHELLDAAHNIGVNFIDGSVQIS
ncbi:aldo/keto reductase [Halobacterium sp. KA-6]|nr:aldo/keto reductase [Halobacterium sp. KA-6]